MVRVYVAETARPRTHKAQARREGGPAYRPGPETRYLAITSFPYLAEFCKPVLPRPFCALASASERGCCCTVGGRFAPLRPCHLRRLPSPEAPRVAGHA